MAGIAFCYYGVYWNEAVRQSVLRTAVLMLVWSWSYFGFTIYWVHDASHASFTHSPWVWDSMGIIYNFVMGFSDKVWFYKHGICVSSRCGLDLELIDILVLGHHPYTNIVGVDPDISTEPFSITRFLPSQEWLPLYSFQHIYGPALYSLLTHFSKLQDIFAYTSLTNDQIPMNPFTTSDKFIFWGGKVCRRFCRVYSLSSPK